MAIFLDDYQQDALSRMKTGCILCGGVGSGKSRTALAYYFIKEGGKLEPYAQMDLPRDLYIITTAMKRDTLEWEGELGYFLMSTDEEKNCYGNKIVVDSWNNIKKYTKVEGAFFIFDEQRVVGSGAWVKAFLKIAKANTWILLSATPGDTWSDYIPVFIANGFYKNRTEFLQRHAVYSRFSKYPKIDRYVETGRLIRLRNDILVTMDYKKPAESVNLNVEVSYDILAYKSLTRTRWNVDKDEPIVSPSEFCYELRKIVNKSCDRLLAVQDIASKKKRVIVFYNYDYELDILEHAEYYTTEGKQCAVAQWNGHKHEPIPDTEAWVYLVQYTAGAEGWNCTKTDTMIFYSESYSYKAMMQAAGRIDRRNTSYKYLYYYHIKSKAPIDIAVSRALKQKKQFNERAFSETH